MSAVYSDELKRMVQQYIDGDRKVVDRLKTVLKSTSVAVVYRLIMDVRGSKASDGSIFHQSAHRNDVGMLEYLLEGFSVVQLTNTLNSSSVTTGVRTAFHHAAWVGSAHAITYLLKRTAKDACFERLSKKDDVGDTALHDAATQNHLQIVQALLSAVTAEQQVQLLIATNNKDQSVADILSTKYPQVVALAVVQQKITKLKTDLAKQKTERDREMSASKEKHAEVNKKQMEMDRKQVEMDRKQVEMDRKRVEMDRKQVELDGKQVEMDRKQDEMDRKLSKLEIYLRQTICFDDIEDQEHPHAE